MYDGLLAIKIFKNFLYCIYGRKKTDPHLGRRSTFGSFTLGTLANFYLIQNCKKNCCENKNQTEIYIFLSLKKYIFFKLKK